MKTNDKRRSAQAQRTKMQRSINDVFVLILFILFATVFYLAISFTPLTKEEHVERYERMTDDIEPFRKNLTECARQVKADGVDVEKFLKRVPQSSLQGKCFVACILKRNAIIRNNKIDKGHLLELNRQVYGEDSEVMSRLKGAIAECSKAVESEGIFEVCEYASVFNDCMHMKMEHILDQTMMERRLEAMAQVGSDPDQWSEDEDEMLKLVRDEL